LPGLLAGGAADVTPRPHPVISNPPTLSEKRTYRFKLRVTDKKGADSMPAFVDVTVEP